MASTSGRKKHSQPGVRSRRFRNWDHLNDNSFSPQDLGPVQRVFHPGTELQITGATIPDAQGDQNRTVHTGRAYKGDGSARILITGLVTGFTIEAVCGSPVIGAGRIQLISGETVCGISISGADGSVFGFYKCDEGTGTTCYDSSGNENHGTIDSITGSTFFTTQNFISYQNEVGYNIGTTTGGALVYIPRDESNPSYDVLGASLAFTGRVKYNLILGSTFCGNVPTTSGTAVIFDNSISAGAVLTNRGLTGATLTPSSRTISFTGTGHFFDVTIVNSSGDMIVHLPCAEGGGLRLYDDSGNNNHATISGITEEAFWEDIYQAEYFKNLVEGFSLFTGTGLRSISIPFHKYKYPLNAAIPTGHSFAGHHFPGTWHNGCETSMYQAAAPELIQADLISGSNFWFSVVGGFKEIWNYNLSGDVNHRIFADIHLESENKWLNFILMGSGLTATDLFDLQVFLWQAP